MVLARDAVRFLSGIAVISVWGCGNADPGPSAPYATVVRTLTKTEARAEIAAMCPGPFHKHRECASCAEQATSMLEAQGWIPAGHVELASFVANDCLEGDACVAAEVPLGPDFQRCVCNDGTMMDMCAEVECSSSQAQDVICVEACRCNGGLFGTACVAGAAACAP